MEGASVAPSKGKKGKREKTPGPSKNAVLASSTAPNSTAEDISKSLFPDSIPTTTTDSYQSDSDHTRVPQDVLFDFTGTQNRERIVKNLWQICCDEVSTELSDLTDILTKMDLPTGNYCKDKTYPLTDYEDAPDCEKCKAKDFLDFYVFPILLPGIQSLIQFAKMNRVFQCRVCSFNSLDYIVEYLYNNNPRYPERMENPTPLFEIRFVKEWLARYPRPPLPKWMTMTEDQAAKLIQRAIRGFLVRVRPNVQEMRIFWKDYKKDLEVEKLQRETHGDKPAIPLFSPYYSELAGELDSHISFGNANTHSDVCMVCSRFKEFIQYQDELKKLNPSASTGDGDSLSDEDENGEANDSGELTAGGTSTAGGTTTAGGTSTAGGTHPRSKSFFENKVNRETIVGEGKVKKSSLPPARGTVIQQ